MTRRRPKWKKPTGAGKKVDVYLTRDVLPVYEQIENKSAFFQLALRNAPGIMAWAILKQSKPERYNDDRVKPLEQVIGDFNKAFPLDPLTAKRKQNGARTKPEDERPNPFPDSPI